MRNRVGAYVPEQTFWEKKDCRECRPFFDDCAVLANDGTRVIASRGFADTVGEPFLEAVGVSCADRARVSSLLGGNEERLLVPCRGGTLVLLFTWYRFTGLVLAIRMHASEQDLHQAFALALREELSPIFAPEHTAPSTPSCREQVRELLFYLARLHAPTATLWSQCLTAARFAGCSLRLFELSLADIHLYGEERQRMAAFWVTLFLSLRAQNGLVFVEKGLVEPFEGLLPLSSHDLPLHVKQSPTDAVGEEDARSRFPFLSLPVFSHCRIRLDKNSLFLEFKLPHDNGVSASPGAFLSFRFVYVEEQ